MCFGGNPWSKTNRLLAQQRKQYEQQQQQRQRQQQQQQQQYMLRQQQREHDPMTRREHSHSRSQTPQNVAQQQTGQRQYRYAQPPAFDVARARDSSASSTHSSAANTPNSFKPPPYAAMRGNTPLLVPTPVPGAPRTPIVIRQETGPDDWNLWDFYQYIYIYRTTNIWYIYTT